MIRKTSPDKAGECLLCLRLPIEKVLEKTHEIYSDLEEAHRVGALAAKLLQEAYLKDPPALCGKRPKPLMASAIYVAGILEGLPKPQMKIADVCGTTQEAVRKRYHQLVKILGHGELKRHLRGIDPEIDPRLYHRMGLLEDDGGGLNNVEREGETKG